MEKLNETMHRFWEVESYQELKKIDLEEEYCKRHFKTTYNRQADGRFIIQLPVK